MKNLYNKLMNIFKQNNDDRGENHTNVREQVLNILHNLGCAPTINAERNNAIEFTFQGMSFEIETYPETSWVTITLFWAIQMPLTDVNDISKLKDAINIWNFNRLTHMIYTVNTEQNIFGIHFQYNWLMYSADPSIQTVFPALLTIFFNERNAAFDYLNKVNLEQKKNPVIGFHLDKSETNKENKE